MNRENTAVYVPVGFGAGAVLGVAVGSAAGDAGTGLVLGIGLGMAAGGVATALAGDSSGGDEAGRATDGSA